MFRVLLPALTAILCTLSASDLDQADARCGLFNGRFAARRPVLAAAVRAPARVVGRVIENQPVRRAVRGSAVLAGRVVLGRGVGAVPTGTCATASNCAAGVCSIDRGEAAAEAAFLAEPQFDGLYSAGGPLTTRLQIRDRAQDRMAKIVAERPDLRKRIAAYGEARGMGKIDPNNLDQVLTVLIKHFTALLPLLLQILATF